MTPSLIHARHERMFGKGRRRKRRLRTSDEIWLTFIDQVTTVLDEAERDLRAMGHRCPPDVLAQYRANAAETRRELEALRRDILTGPIPPR